MALLDQTRWHDLIYTDGAWRPGSGAATDVVEPATGDTLAQFTMATPDDVAQASRTAREAQREWAATPHVARAAVLRKAAALFAEHADEIAWWNIREVGAIPGLAGFAIHVAEQECWEAAALPSRPYGELVPSTEPRLSMTRRYPVGVVGVISPFNVPIILGIRSIAPALALGNAVVLKPDPRTAITGGLVMARIFQEAGLPDGLLQVLPGGADVGEALVTDPSIAVVSFTGSTAAGRRVGELAGRHLKRAHLELGGNSALVVLEDADVDQAVNLAAWGSWFHQGQICMTTGRHLVHERLYDDFVERLADKAGKLPVGDPAREEVALGPIIDAGQRDKIHALVEASTAVGARLAAGGSYDRLFYRPTVLAGVGSDTPAFAQEIFGPVAPVAKFGSNDEAVALATATEYGLSLGIVTRDAMRGVEIADRIPTGIVHINDQTVNDEANAPFGGIGASGTGSRFGGALANVDAFTETRWLTVRSQAAGYPF
jgi:benzaldehyde dehydrogenase (NAD)